MTPRQTEAPELSDVFLVLTAVFLACVGFAAFMRRPTGAPGGGGDTRAGAGSVAAKETGGHTAPGVHSD